MIVKAGSDAVNVGQVEYELRCGAVIARRQRLIPVDGRLAEAPDVAQLVARQAAVLVRELETVVGRTPVALDGRESLVRREPTPLGHLLATLMRERVGAEVGLLNSGAIRGNRVIPSGPITRRDVREILPFTNTVTLLEVTGEALRAALERSVDELPRATGHYLQTSGVDVTLDPAQPPAAGSSGSRSAAVPSIRPAATGSPPSITCPVAGMATRCWPPPGSSWAPRTGRASSRRSWTASRQAAPLDGHGPLR